MNDRRGRQVMGITGGIACGKSEVGRILERRGFAVCDADNLAHAVIAPGGEAREAVVRRFGPEILDAGAGGAVDRAALARRVFGDPRALADLNAIVHPAARRALDRWLAALPPDRDAAALVPLLFEAGWTAGWTAVICVAADPARVRERLARRGWTEEESQRRLSAQWPLEEKMRRADYVIRNDGTLAELECAVAEMLRRIRDPEQENRHDAG